MKGKITNLCIAGMNVLFGIMIAIYTYYIPQDIIGLTVQELMVTKISLKIIYILLAIVEIIDVFQYASHKDNREIKTGYLFGIFSISFFFIKAPPVAILPILSGFIVFFNTLRDNVIDIDSTTAISIIAVICLAIIITATGTFFYEQIGQYIKKQENKNTQSYSNDYFKYITELGIEEPYINVKVNNKYGYINPQGDIVINFKYDYASPFVNINAYNKEFQIALVVEDGLSKIIMKNERQVMSYKSETANEDYDSKLEELEKIYTNTFKQEIPMTMEIEKNNDKILKINKYDEISTDYTYRYDYNEDYDIIVSKSSFGLDDKYELAKKDDINIRINLECDNLDYDENYLYLFNNGLIPFYNVDNKKQGWFTSYGMPHTMNGNAQILEIIDDDKIIIRNYSKNNDIYFTNQNSEELSEHYKSLIITNDGYIVKNQNNKYEVLNKDLQKKFDAEYNAIDPYLVDLNLYICTNTDQAIEFNDYNFAIMNWKLVNSEGNVILDNIEQIYSSSFKISNNKDEAYIKRYSDFLKNLENIKSRFVGDKFYSSYLK